MKLNSQQAAAVKRAMSVDPIDEENPAMEPLKSTFGDHTFYVVTEGLFVLEPMNDPGHPGEPAQFVRIATWTDDQMNALQPVEPQQTNTVVDLAEADGDGSDGSAEVAD